MRSRVESARSGAWWVVWLLLLACAASPVLARGERPSDAQIEAAVAALEADPNLARERKMRTLRWVRENEPAQPPSSFARWLRDLFVWLSQISRALMWVLGGVLGLALVFGLARLLRKIGKPARRAAIPDAPTHVRELDIRPQSLPEDIGAAALTLWERGEQRLALALLYRGLLSRLAHAYRVPIRASSTERECLALAHAHLPEPAYDYAARLIDLWQRAVYGAGSPTSTDVRALCAGFDAALGTRAATASVTR